MEGKKKYIGSVVETPDGNLGRILDYNENTDTYDVKLNSGKSGKFKSSELTLITLSKMDMLEESEDGGSEDW